MGLIARCAAAQLRPEADADLAGARPAQLRPVTLGGLGTFSPDVCRWGVAQCRPRWTSLTGRLLTWSRLAVVFMVACEQESLPIVHRQPMDSPPAPSFDDDFGLVAPPQPTERGLPVGVRRRRDCADPRSSGFFFPVGTFRGPGQPRHYDVDASDRHGVSAILRAVDEPSLSCRSRSSTDLRFVWIRSFQQAVVVRVSYPADRSYEPFVLVDAPGYDGGSLIERSRRALSRTDGQLLVASLESRAERRVPALLFPALRVGGSRPLAQRRLRDSGRAAGRDDARRRNCLSRLDRCRSLRYSPRPRRVPPGTLLGPGSSVGRACD